MTDLVEVLLILIDVALTLVNLGILAIGVKLYTDQKKQNLLGEIKRR